MKGLSKKKRVSTWLALGITVVSCFALSGEVQASVERTKVDEFANVLDVSASQPNGRMAYTIPIILIIFLI